MSIAFRAALIVQQKVIIELKSVEQIAPVHPKQLLTLFETNRVEVGIAD